MILSACNTAGAQGEGAEALSGMARAFFYAGARALLVSNWEVESDAAVKLTNSDSLLPRRHSLDSCNVSARSTASARQSTISHERDEPLDAICGRLDFGDPFLETSDLRLYRGNGPAVPPRAM